jgi:hypothetical protein
MIYEKYHADDDYLFINIYGQRAKQDKNLVLMINNSVSSITEKMRNIEEIYKFYYHMCINNNFSNIYIISMRPDIHIFEINNKIDNNFFLALFQQKYFYRTYNNKYDFENIAAKFIHQLEIIKNNGRNAQIDMEVYILDKRCNVTQYELSKLTMCTICKQIMNYSDINYDIPNPYVPILNQQHFLINDDKLIFANSNTPITGIINGKLIILCKNMGTGENVIVFDDTIKLLQYMYEMYIIYNKQPVDKFVYVFFEKYISIIDNNIIAINECFYIIINIIKEWQHVNTFKFNNKLSRFNNFFEKSEIQHISHKKYIKMIKNLKPNSYIKNFDKNIEKNAREVFKLIENIKNNEIEKSIIFFNSQFSLSNWIDEIEENGCLGILLDINVPNFCRNGKSIDLIEIKIYQYHLCLWVILLILFVPKQIQHLLETSIRQVY